MTTDLPAFVRDIQPQSTVLFFGSGFSLPSHAPRVADVIEHFSHIFNQPSDGFTLSELTDLIEQKTKDRQRMISELRKMFEHLKPTGGLLNLPFL